jgi:hypothetical protein
MASTQPEQTTEATMITMSDIGTALALTLFGTVAETGSVQERRQREARAQRAARRRARVSRRSGVRPRPAGA